MSAGETALAPYRWENRVLLVFAPDVDSTLCLRQQEMLLDAKPGLNERDVVVISVLKGIVSTKERPAAPVSADDLRDAYDVLPHDFRVVLIGKDGGVKLRQDEPILAADLFALIDTMPMAEGRFKRCTITSGDVTTSFWAAVGSKVQCT